jgi:hypothetical protein
MSDTAVEIPYVGTTAAFTNLSASDTNRVNNAPHRY